MAKALGVMGLPNTGKSFSRSFIKDGSDCFVISPSQKFSHLFDTNKKALPSFNFKVGELTWKELANKNGTTKDGMIAILSQVDTAPPDFKMIGNSAIVLELEHIISYLRFIDKHMPHIKNVFLADFTHWMSSIIASAKFKARTSGGQAFARFWDLAGDALNAVFKAVESLERDDLLVITEFHAQVPQDANAEGEIFYDIFVPAGKMLNNSFLPKSYFDYMLCSTVLPYEEDEDGNCDDSKRYKFVVTKKAPYDGRMANLFADIAHRGMIPNNMGMVLERTRKHMNLDG